MSRKNIERPCEFEEKEYEIPLYFEMLGTPGRLWSPGQVLENVAGVDCVMKASSAYARFVGRSRKTGVTLNRLFLTMTGMAKSRAAKKRVAKLSAAAASMPPSFKVNLLIQAKRCNYYDLGQHPRGCDPLRRPEVWRTFRRTKHQQILLEKLSAGLRQKGKPLAEVTYAAPSFHERIDLWKNTTTRRLMTRSTFPPAEDLKGHVRWAYSAPGATGKALSVPVDVDRADLNTRMIRLVGAEIDEATEETVLGELEHLDRVTTNALAEAGLPDLGMGDDRDPDKDEESWVEEEVPRLGLLAARVAARLGRHGIVWMVAGGEHGGPEW